MQNICFYGLKNKSLLYVLILRAAAVCVCVHKFTQLWLWTSILFLSQVAGHMYFSEFLLLSFTGFTGIILNYVQIFCEYFSH